MNKLFYITLPLIILFMIAAPLRVFAIENDEQNFDFPLCSNQTEPGDQASYPEGWHQIVGGDLLWGSDDVYSLDNGNFLQCYCPIEDIEGIQTNWLDSTNFNEETKQSLIDAGWFDIGNGPDWGLPAQTYLAQNLSFTCHGDNNGESSPSPSASPTTEASPSPSPSPSMPPIGGASPSSSATPTPTPSASPSDSATKTSDSNPDNTSSPQPQATPNVEAKRGEVLGITNLPQTGNTTSIVAGFMQLAGLVTLSYGGYKTYGKKRA